VVCLPVCLSVTFVYCSQTAEVIDTISFTHDIRVSFPDRLKDWLTPIDPFLPKFRPKVLKKRCRLDLKLYFFSERVVNIWNSLDDQLVTSSSLNSFKSNLSRLRRQSMGLFIDNFVCWLYNLHLCSATKLRDKVARLCCVSDMGLRVVWRWPCWLWVTHLVWQRLKSHWASDCKCPTVIIISFWHHLVLCLVWLVFVWL